MTTDQEKNHFNELISKGVSIEVESTRFERENGFFGLIKKRKQITEKLKFIIQEPTLKVLELISAEQLQLKVDESTLKFDSFIDEAKKLVSLYGKKMAKILALAVLGQDFIITIQKGHRTKYAYDYKKLNELTELFQHNIKPSKLLQYVILINSMSNLGDFLNSVRLMSANRTTVPIEINN